MRNAVRATALFLPVFAALLVGAAYQSGAHLSQVRAAGFVGAVFLISWLVLQATRSRQGGQSRRSRRGRSAYPYEY